MLNLWLPLYSCRKRYSRILLGFPGLSKDNLWSLINTHCKPSWEVLIKKQGPVSLPGLILILKPRAPQERFEWPPWQAQSVLLLFRSDPKASLPLLLVMACQEGLQLKLEASASISQCWRMWLLQDTPSRASPKLPLVPFIVTINFSFYSLVCLWNDVIWGRRSLPEVSTIHSQTKG